MNDSPVIATHFREWAKPGVIPPGAASAPDVPAAETLDALSGHFRIYQLRDGHRFSTDDLLSAWYGTTWVPSARRVLDLGSGIGSVGMIAAWRLVGARFVTIEAQEDSVRLARKSAAYNGLLDRYDIRQGDFRGEGVMTPDERFDLVLGSPPYFPRGTGIEGDHPQRVACRFELRGDIGDYARIAASRLAGGGVFAFVFPEDQRDRAAGAVRDASMIVVRRRPVVFRDGDPPMIGLWLAIRATDLPASMREMMWEEPPLVIRTRDGRVHPEYAAVKLAIGFAP